MDFKYKLLMIFSMLVMISGFTYASNLQTSDGSAVTLGNSLNISNMDDVNNRLNLISKDNESYAGLWYYPDPEYPDTAMVALTVHKVHPTLLTEHKHFSIYTTNADYSQRINRFDIDYGADNVDVNFYNITGVDFDNGDLTDVGSIAMTGNINLALNDLVDTRYIYAKSGNDLAIRGGTGGSDVILQVRNGAGTLKSVLIVRDGTPPYIQLGTASDPVNISMFSPDGTEYSCGVSNGGSFSCS